MNSCLFMGRLTEEPSQKFTHSGKQVVSFSIAVPIKFKRDGGPTADFIDCEAWEVNAKNIFNFFHKGDGILVRGRMKNNNYTNRDGQKVYGMVLVVEEWDFGRPKKGSDMGNPQGGYGGNGTGYYNPGGTINDGGYSQYPEMGSYDGFMDLPEGYENEVPFV